MTEEIKEFIEKYNLTRFKSLKVKVNQDSCRDMLNKVLESYDGTIRIDANEAFDTPGSLVNAIQDIPESRIDFIEQPFKAEQIKDYIFLKDNYN